MKTAFFCVVFLATASAFGQIVGAVLSNEAQPVSVPSHPITATQRSVASGTSLLIPSVSTQARGERPLWELAPPQRPEVPLGDIARTLKKQHDETAKKAVKVMEN
jgi:hypothetical protein